MPVFVAHELLIFIFQSTSLPGLFQPLNFFIAKKNYCVFVIWCMQTLTFLDVKLSRLNIDFNFSSSCGLFLSFRLQILYVLSSKWIMLKLQFVCFFHFVVIYRSDEISYFCLWSFKFESSQLLYSNKWRGNEFHQKRKTGHVTIHIMNCSILKNVVYILCETSFNSKLFFLLPCYIIVSL